MINQEEIEKLANDYANRYYLNSIEISKDSFLSGVEVGQKEFKKGIWHNTKFDKTIPYDGKVCIVVMTEFIDSYPYYIMTYNGRRNCFMNDGFLMLGNGSGNFMWCYLSDILPNSDC